MKSGCYLFDRTAPCLQAEFANPVTSMSANPSAPANLNPGNGPQAPRSVEIRGAPAQIESSNQSCIQHHQSIQLATTIIASHLSSPQSPTCPNCANEKTRRYQVPMQRPALTLTLPPPRPLVSSNRTSATEGIFMRPPSKSCERSVRRSLVGSSSSLVCLP